jgi:enoyl-CoA hydratase/carnithine racemase
MAVVADGTAVGKVSYERRGRIAHIVLRRPEKLNAFNDAQVLALKDALNRFDADDDAWVAIISGEGRAFSSGADVKERQLRPREEMARLGGPEGRGAEGHGNLYKCVNWKPVLTAVHGYALGMALGLVLESDLAVAAQNTKMQITETRRGLWGGLYWARMQFRGAGAFADEVALTGRYFTGAEAAAHNVIAAAVPEGQHLEKAEEFAEAILMNPPLAVRSVVRARRYYMQRYEFEQPLLREPFPLHLTDDFRESALAFAEHREPRPFTGR